MNEWDLVIFSDSFKENISNRFQITNRTMKAAGQHGKISILTDENNNEWLLKIFKNIIDFELKEIMNLEVDIEETSEKSRNRMHLWRVLNELTASRLGRCLKLNIPEVIVICSQKITDFPLETNSPLPLGDVIILDTENGNTETTEEYYNFMDRENYIFETSQKFEKLLSKKSEYNDSSTVIAILIRKVPNSLNLDAYIESFGMNHEKAFENIRHIDDGYNLLPLDIWLNDPDRNAGNYLIQFDDKKRVHNIWGIDYEMWSLGSDQIEDKIAMGRSYLAAIIHSTTNIFDERILRTIHRIRNLEDEEITKITRAPQILCKFFEYHIEHGNLEPDERIVLKQIEQNLDDFLLESKPKSDKLTIILAKQIGLPHDFEE